jgi:hypothetical protein
MCQKLVLEPIWILAKKINNKSLTKCSSWLLIVALTSLIQLRNMLMEWLRGVLEKLYMSLMYKDLSLLLALKYFGEAQKELKLAMEKNTFLKVLKDHWKIYSLAMWIM